MDWTADADPLDRLRATATATRDLVVHTDATRWEVYAKASTVHQLMFDPEPPLEASIVHETGVAVRTTRRGEAGFGAASGLEVRAARTAVEAAQAATGPLPFDPLPPARLLGCTEVEESAPLPAAGWTAEVAERLSRGVLAASDSSLVIRRLLFHEGLVAWLLATGDGFVATRKDASLALIVELGSRGDPRQVYREWLWIARPGDFEPENRAAQMCDRALLGGGPRVTREGQFDVLLHPEVSAHLLAATTPLFLPVAERHDPLPGLVDRNGRLAGEVLTLVDDRSRSDCPASAPCDGEGIPSARRILLDRGVPRHRLAAHFEAQFYGEPTHGGARRLSYRDYPRTGIGALAVEGDPATAPGEILAAAGSSLYLLRLLAPPTVDLAADTFRLRGEGVWLGSGGVDGVQPVVEISGALSLFLRRIEAVGTDTAWYQTAAGFIAAPTLWATHQRVTA